MAWRIISLVFFLLCLLIHVYNGSLCFARTRVSSTYPVITSFQVHLYALHVQEMAYVCESCPAWALSLHQLYETPQIVDFIVPGYSQYLPILKHTLSERFLIIISVYIANKWGDTTHPWCTPCLILIHSRISPLWKTAGLFSGIGLPVTVHHDCPRLLLSVDWLVVHVLLYQMLCCSQWNMHIMSFCFSIALSDILLNTNIALHDWVIIMVIQIRSANLGWN